MTYFSFPKSPRELQRQLPSCISKQMQTEHTGGQIYLTTSINGHTKLTDRHAKMRMHIIRQPEHANGHTKRQTKHAYWAPWWAKWAKWQTNVVICWVVSWMASTLWRSALSKRNRQNNLIEIIKKIMNMPCNTPASPEFISLNCQHLRHRTTWQFWRNMTTI